MMDAYTTKDLQTALQIVRGHLDRPSSAVASLIAAEIERRVGVVKDAPARDAAAAIGSLPVTCPDCGRPMRVCPESSRLAGMPVWYCRCGRSLLGGARW